MSRDLLHRRRKISEAKIAQSDTVELVAGQIRVKVDSFALTANNMTYGAYGNAYRYWSFFPAPDDWGRVPVWGFATVTETACDGIDAGERVYGFWPMSESFVMEPVKIRDASFVDGTAHREPLPAVYNNYSRCAADPVYHPDFEAEQMILYPLFVTSFLLADFCMDNDWFGARSIVITSASSKTALGTADVLRELARGEVKVTGLTSAGNQAFVSKLGVYDNVLTYDDIDSLNVEPAVLLDFSGNLSLLRQIHTRLGDDLRYSCRIGSTHYDEGHTGDGGDPLPGPEPVAFFAPTQIQKRFKEWGPEGYAQRFGSHWQRFALGSRTWMRIEESEGLEGADSVFQTFVAGRADPTVGHVIKL